MNKYFLFLFTFFIKQVYSYQLFIEEPKIIVFNNNEIPSIQGKYYRECGKELYNYTENILEICAFKLNPGLWDIKGSYNLYDFDTIWYSENKLKEICNKNPSTKLVDTLHFYLIEKSFIELLISFSLVLCNNCTNYNILYKLLIDHSIINTKNSLIFEDSNHILQKYNIKVKYYNIRRKILLPAGKHTIELFVKSIRPWCSGTSFFKGFKISRQMLAWNLYNYKTKINNTNNIFYTSDTTFPTNNYMLLNNISYLFKNKY